MNSSVNPTHYKLESGKEVKDILKDLLTQDEYEGFLKGNIIKYIARYKMKNGLEDLRKAQVYLGWLINEVGRK